MPAKKERRKRRKTMNGSYDIQIFQMTVLVHSPLGNGSFWKNRVQIGD